MPGNNWADDQYRRANCQRTRSPASGSFQEATVPVAGGLARTVVASSYQIQFAAAPDGTGWNETWEPLPVLALFHDLAALAIWAANVLSQLLMS